MNKICTSLEQSKELIELGIDVSTADMCYRIVAYNPNDTHVYQPYCFVGTLESDIPAWSLSALLNLMPPYLFEFERGIDLNIYPSLNGKAWHCGYMPNAVENMKNDKFKQITKGDNLIGAAFEMVVWLKKNKKL